VDAIEHLDERVVANAEHHLAQRHAAPRFNPHPRLALFFNDAERRDHE
jgi:hypothetical protein